MERIPLVPRPHWRQLAESVGFGFHTIDNAPYWDESAYYRFSLAQIERDIEAPTEIIHAMAMDLVPEILGSERLLRQLHIPEWFWNHLANSWREAEPHLYGRLDLCYDGKSPAKLLELNYDTPTSLFETGFFQWVWLEEQIAAGHLPAQADQFNSLQDQLEDAFKTRPFPSVLHFASLKGHEEDKGTVDYLMDIAQQAGLSVQYVALEDIGEYNGQFVDAQNQEIRGLFKLYPWELMLEDAFARQIPFSNTQFIEPPWKMILSNKGLLPLLWERHPNHPNLLPSFFEEKTGLLEPGWVRKPLHSREGANVELVELSGRRHQVPGPYTGPCIRQALAPLPAFQASGTTHYPVIGSWLVGDCAAGMGIREDVSLITQDSSRFLPHCLVD